MAMFALVTGAAGFIGSRLSENLLQKGWKVRGVDCFTDFYPRRYKEENLSGLRGRDGFELLETDLVSARVQDLLDGITEVFHLAAQAGVRSSWGQEFKIYSDSNILATQRLLEGARESRTLNRFVFASSSSIYGDSLALPTPEETALNPVSPYGVSKAAGDNLCRLYHRNFGLPTIRLRYFTVYGPRQRPDMAFHRFLKAIALGEEIRVFGDGSQSRDFTYVDDIAAGTVASLKGVPGRAFNLGGNRPIDLMSVIRTMEGVVGKKARLKIEPKAFGDVTHTAADVSRAADELGYRPGVGLEQGLAREFQWVKDFYSL